MSTFVALALALLGVLCIAAGVQNRGVELGRTILGAGGGTGAVAPAAAKAPTTPAGVTFA